MKNALFLSVLLFISAPTLAEEAKPSDLWFQCKVDADCVDIDFECAVAIVNKSFAKVAREYYGLMNARTNCTGSGNQKSDSKIPYKLFCEKNRCNRQGTNPKGPGFS
jgi:hypothetical protein